MRQQHDRGAVGRVASRGFLIGLPLAIAFLCFTQTISAGNFPVENARDLRLTKAKIRAAQFLSKATFGPTQDSIDELANRITQIGLRRAIEEWIDHQFAEPTTSHEAVTP